MLKNCSLIQVVLSLNKFGRDIPLSKVGYSCKTSAFFFLSQTSESIWEYGLDGDPTGEHKGSPSGMLRRHVYLSKLKFPDNNLSNFFCTFFLGFCTYYMFI